MERLTHYETPEKHAYVDRGLVSLGWYSMTDEGFRGPAIDRLAAYEDTGLTPERVAELARADQAGRLVVLPCKVGDIVYVVGTCRVIECCINEAYLDDKKGLEYLVSFECDSDCDGCPFDSWRQDYSGEYSCDGEYGEATIRGTDFGKTVFLTRQEAEAAVEGKEVSDDA